MAPAPRLSRRLSSTPLIADSPVHNSATNVTRPDQKSCPAMAFSSEPEVRFGASQALGSWTAHEVSPEVDDLIDRLLQGLGARIPLAVVVGLGTRNPSAVARNQTRLLNCASATSGGGPKKFSCCQRGAGTDSSTVPPPRVDVAVTLAFWGP